MHEIYKNIEQRIRVWEWYERNQQTVTTVQFLLALEYFNNYGYAIDVACPLALESYKVNSLRKK